MSNWLYLAMGTAILAIFLVFLSGIIKKRALGVVLMFIFTILASASFGYGIYNARIEAKENLGKPIQEITEGEYEIFWIARNANDDKIYIVADKIENPPKSDIRLYTIKPSDPFLNKLRELLKSGRPLIMMVETNEEGIPEPSLHPSPPQELPPKNP